MGQHLETSKYEMKHGPATKLTVATQTWVQSEWFHAETSNS